MINTNNDEYFRKSDSSSSSSNNKIVLKMERRSSVKSPFIKMGEMLKEYKNEALYDFKNFEFLKLGEEFHVIGSGAFGDVFLAKNTKDGKYYAIKQVKKILNLFLDGNKKSNSKRWQSGNDNQRNRHSPSSNPRQHSSIILLL
jgi:hypothetical protein